MRTLLRWLFGWKFQYRWRINFLWRRWNFVNFRNTSSSTHLGPYNKNHKTGRTTINTPGRGFLLRKSNKRYRRR